MLVLMTNEWLYQKFYYNIHLKKFKYKHEEIYLKKTFEGIKLTELRKN